MTKKCKTCGVELTMKPYEIRSGQRALFLKRQSCSAICGRPRGEESKLAKINVAIVKAIRKRREAGSSLKELAEKYNITSGHVASIVSRRAWAHVK